MSHGQTKLSEYYSKRKKCDGLQPSKRRKVLMTEDVETTTFSQLKSPPIGARTRSRITKNSKVSHPVPSHLNAQVEVQNTKTTLLKTSKVKSKIPVKPSNQKTIKEALSNVSNQVHATEAPVKDKSEEILIKSEPTAACDNHNASPPGTPTKRRQGTKQIQEETRKRSRCKKVTAKDLFQEETDLGFSFDKNVANEERKIVSPRRRSTENKEEPLIFKFQGKEKDAVKEARIKKLAEDVFGPTKDLEEKTVSDSKPKSKSVLEASEPQAKMENLKSQTSAALMKNPAAMKAKLQHITNLSDLKEKLKQLRQSPKKKVRGEVMAKSPVKSSLVDIVKDTKISAVSSPSVRSSRPAYERFSALEEPVPPGLTLPKHYKLLQDQFNSTDTIVSILHKRAEICTFSKIKPAVQQMTSKNFELKMLGQIKTVYPTAYHFKQEKNLPCYGKKKSNEFQLTVEANLVDDPLGKPCDVKQLTKDGRQDFTGSKMMERKFTFHRRLIDILRKHHKEFLSRLERPLMIPDHKVTRWHPKFSLDGVPEVEVAELPKPENAHIITTAKEALEHAKEKFNNPRVIKALEKVVATKSESNDSKNKTPKKCPPSADSPKPNTSTLNTNTSNTNKVSKSDNQALKGVSMSFLEKIRAKEARIQEELMFRTPADEKKRERMSRLPELVRIIRTLFVTSKKQAMLKADVIEKLTDSYKACMGQAEAESHLKLIVEMVPEWVSVVTLKRGIFITINKNKDINVIIETLDKKRKQLP